MGRQRYTLLFGGFLLLGGRAADLFGRRNLFVAGVMLFSVASLVNGLASSEEMLIGARALQGLGGALMSPAALAVITTTFAEGAERTKALSIWAAIASGGSAVGLLLGGVLTETLSWEWIFFINVPIGVAIMLAAFRLVPNSRVEGGSRHFDIAGAVSVTAGLLVLVYAIVKAEDWGWASGSTLGLAALALALLGGFIAIESRSPFPLVRLGLFKLRSLAVANGAFLLVVGGLFAMFFFASLYLQNILGYSAITTGLAFLPVTLGIMMGAVTAQQLTQKIGVRPVMLTGLSVAALGLTILGITTQVDGNYLGVLGGLFPMAVGMGATFVSLTLVATTNVDESDAGLASGIFNTSQQVGGALGLAILSTLANDRTSSDPRGHRRPADAGSDTGGARRGLPARVLRGRRADRRRRGAARGPAAQARRRPNRRRRCGCSPRLARCAPTPLATASGSSRRRRRCSRSAASTRRPPRSRIAPVWGRRPCSAASPTRTS